MMSPHKKVFWSLNLGLAAVATISLESRVLAGVALLIVSVVSAVWAVTGLADRPRYHAILGSKWVEAEVGVYSALAFWAGVLAALVAPVQAEQNPLFTIICLLVSVGMVGMVISLLPLTSEPRSSSP